MTVDELLEAVASGKSARRADSATEAIAMDASNEAARMEARPTGEREHIADLNREGSLRTLGRDLSRQRGYDSDDDQIDANDPDAVLDALAEAVRDRQAGK
jgi:hypothetical protein